MVPVVPAVPRGASGDTAAGTAAPQHQPLPAAFSRCPPEAGSSRGTRSTECVARGCGACGPCVGMGLDFTS